MIHTLRSFFEKVSRDNVSAFSAQAALFIMISSFPFVMVLLNLLRFFPISQIDLILFVKPLLPETIAPFAASVISDLYQKSTGTLLSVSAVVTLWSSSRGALSIIHGLNAVYDIEENRNYFVLRFMSCFYTLVFILMILASLLMLVFGNSVYQLIAQKAPLLRALAGIFISMRTFLFLGVLTLFFMFLYKAIPDRKSKLIHHVPGALFAASGWLLFSFVFSIYIDHYGNYSYMYGSLTTIVVSMLWIHICMYIVFLGGENNHYFEPMIVEMFLRMHSSP
jgi:membrane protein